ncbi:hypothetical protein L1987_15009 [Smallanthus sonchifolius]|uniref:Uncharacterized protein n=1 Tax=Smallanthus sonchifolius TaxID=185202 RepID=A0ACB9J575_9ASTR|nr:hypothetical protein L1987_15009 [Smallanthus sonchifolius]
MTTGSYALLLPLAKQILRDLFVRFCNSEDPFPHSSLPYPDFLSGKFSTFSPCVFLMIFRVPIFVKKFHERLLVVLDIRLHTWTYSYYNSLVIDSPSGQRTPSKGTALYVVGYDYVVEEIKESVLDDEECNE